MRKDSYLISLMIWNDSEKSYEILQNRLRTNHYIDFSRETSHWSKAIGNAEANKSGPRRRDKAATANNEQTGKSNQPD